MVVIVEMGDFLLVGGAHCHNMIIVFSSDGYSNQKYISLLHSLQPITETGVPLVPFTPPLLLCVLPADPVIALGGTN